MADNLYNSVTSSLHGELIIYGSQDNSIYTRTVFSGVYANSNSGYLSSFHSVGQYKQTNVVTGFRILAHTGTINGIYNFYGIKNH